MNCEEVRVRLEEKLDGELAAGSAVGLDEHLDGCGSCRQVWNDLQTLKEVLGQPATMPQPLADAVWKKLDQRAKRGWASFLSDSWGALTVYCRDLDRTVVWAKLSAVPVMLMAAFVLLPMNPQSEVEKWTYTLAARNSATQPVRDPVMVHVVQTRSEFRGLVETAWKIPYEDSLWLVADIQPEGNAQIGNVIEYPKNSELLAAVDQTLRRGKFDVAGKLEAPQFIYGFQKVDVYENGVF